MVMSHDIYVEAVAFLSWLMATTNNGISTLPHMRLVRGSVPKLIHPVMIFLRGEMDSSSKFVSIS